MSLFWIAAPLVLAVMGPMIALLYLNYSDEKRRLARIDRRLDSLQKSLASLSPTTRGGGES